MPISLACDHNEVRRSTDHIMATTRYSDQQGSNSRQNVQSRKKRVFDRLVRLQSILLVWFSRQRAFLGGCAINIFEYLPLLALILMVPVQYSTTVLPGGRCRVKRSFRGLSMGCPPSPSRSLCQDFSLLAWLEIIGPGSACLFARGYSCEAFN